MDHGLTTRARSRWSLTHKLPLLISVLLASTLAAMLLLTYATLRDSATDAARVGLNRAADQLGAMFTRSAAQLRLRVARVAQDTVLRRALQESAAGRGAEGADAGAPEVRAALERLLTPGDTGLAVELWAEDGRRVAFAGSDLRATRDHGFGRPETAGGFALPPGLDSLAISDSARIGELYLVDTVPHFWVVAPVVADGRRLGYVARPYRIAEGPGAEETIRGLTGSEVRSYYRSPSGRVWTTISGDRASAPAGRDSTDGTGVVRRPGVGALLAVEERIPGMPLVLALERPMQDVLARTHTTVRRLGLVGLVVLLLGTLAAWGLSRRITAPLVTLTDAADTVARGDYGVRVEPTGDAELVRLAESFNHMAGEVGTTRDELEMQTEEAQAIAEELEASNRDLGDALAEAERARADAEQARRQAEEARGQAEAARVQAEEASRAKSDFLAVMSHELRTPLNAIGGYTELLEMELRGPITDAQRRDLGRIRASQQHLLGLVSAVLDLGRIESRRVSYALEPIAVAPMLAALESLVAPQAATKSLTLTHRAVGAGLGVLADREKLRQILLNLLSNAVRYTPAGGLVGIEASAYGASAVRIAVRDTGIGIAADALERIFEPFVQLDRSLTQGRDGVGLGLAISRDLARGMGGDITVESRLGEGTCFTLVLPQAIVTEAETATAPSGGYPAVRTQAAASRPGPD